jgi:23S rRNA pseudouridine2604 synthase
MESGVNILGTQTLACQVDLQDSNTFVINLTQGLNRQIRRMCFKLGNYVTSLKRLSIGQIKLNQLKPGELMLLDKEEIAWLKNLTKVN